MKKIYKYSLELLDFQKVEMPEGFEILTAQIQNGVLCIWAIVNPENKTTKVEFEILSTGEQMEQERRRYVGTAQDGALVWHVFQILT